MQYMEQIKKTKNHYTMYINCLKQWYYIRFVSLYFIETPPRTSGPKSSALSHYTNRTSWYNGYL